MTDHIISLVTEGGAKPSGLLFHGSGETFDTPLRPGGYDGVLWTSTSPGIAQTYIPRAGITSYVATPSPWELDDRIRPAEHSFWYGLARERGFQALEIDVDASGELRSWRLPEGFPTYRQAVGWLEELGYTLSEHGSAEINMDGDKVMPAGWSMPGRLFVTALDGLRFLDARTGANDLGSPQYHEVGLFRAAEAQGYDGIIIEDYLQDDAYGNVGHHSWGLFAAAAARIPWIDMPAVRRGWDPSTDDTEDYAMFRSSLEAAPQFR